MQVPGCQVASVIDYCYKCQTYGFWAIRGLKPASRMKFQTSGKGEELAVQLKED
jgi:hypothetical protein